eukprot:m.40133 g.40133  ORF g.40133 m.40133 type:complete len:199 (+) comp11339_c0_seq1:161-757(+)
MSSASAVRASSQSLRTFAKQWHLVDARGQRVGRLAEQVGKLLQGKNKPIYHPAAECGDHVVIVNTKHVQLSGRKWEQKTYRKHTGFPGGFREIHADKLHEKDGKALVQRAINGMLPKNKLRKTWMRQLHLFEEDDHPYEQNISNVVQPPQSMRIEQPAFFVVQPVTDSTKPPEGFRKMTPEEADAARARAKALATGQD